jgi:hypothetical protein
LGLTEQADQSQMRCAPGNDSEFPDGIPTVNVAQFAPQEVSLFVKVG